MAVHLRLARAGAKKAPFYHIIATDSRSPRDGKFLEQVGSYDPAGPKVSFDDVKLEKWLKNGAVPTVTVKNLIKSHKAASAA
ncbi:30S ribosomal protein S16 [Vulgatibacter incomptus]|uniref:Small ribosomal subunit protein bS16 n=1 Tax=Vulgatibacter incomptus TaxID=1391653 RepID=A0A0K1PD11_9BACT|nr:30S ribosomal protein S16 [Vulgatibacter incomptus]AKU91286.1 SSU ribosomal protein S16p [Vulgatibacter incomptus]